MMGLVKTTWISILVYGGATYLLLLLFSYGTNFISTSMKQNYARKYSMFRRTNSGGSGRPLPSANGVFFKAKSR